MSKFITIALVLLVLYGIVSVAAAMGTDILGEATKVATNCYDMLNAAGQVVETVCH